MFLLFLPLFVYISGLFNIKSSWVVVFISFVLLLINIGAINPAYFVYSIVASIIIILKIKETLTISKSTIEELEKIKREKEENLKNLKKTAEDVKDYEKKNEIIYSLVNILRVITDIEHLKSINKYIDEYLECETSLYFMLDETPVLIYGKNIDFQDKKNFQRFSTLEIGDKKQKMFILVIHSNDKHKLEEAKELIDEVSSSLKKVFLFEMTENMSQRDGLTGLFRRGVFTEKLNEELIKARNFKHTLGLMMVDIDHFKYINDTYGHQTGDEVLKEVARIIKENVYETDFVARYGGEEFAIIMPRAQIEGSTRKANYIKESVASHRIRAGLVDIKVTISAGIAYYPYDALNGEELIKNADKALYFSKENGRNRITLYKDIKN